MNACNKIPVNKILLRDLLKKLTSKNSKINENPITEPSKKSEVKIDVKEIKEKQLFFIIDKNINLPDRNV